MPKLQDHLIGNADRKIIKDPKVDALLNQMEEVPPIIIGASKYATDIWIRLGRPRTPFSENGGKLVDALIVMWKELYPRDAADWFAQRREYQNAELDTNIQVKYHTGGSLASYPFPLFQMMKRFFPNVKITERKTCKKMISKWPMFRLSKVR